MAATNNNMNFDVNLLPTTTGDHNLGSSDKKWNLYVNNINGAAPLIGVKGSAENSYRTGNVEITKSNIGLGNVENTALSTWAGTSNITTLGTITTGTWNGTTIAVANGGTGATSIANIQAGKDGDGNTISSTYLKLSGGTVSGQLNLSNETASTSSSSGALVVGGGIGVGDKIYANGTIYSAVGFVPKSATLDATSATNGLSNNNLYFGLHSQDKNGNWVSAFRTVAYTNGNIATSLAVRNYLPSIADWRERAVLIATLAKDGTYTYAIGTDDAQYTIGNNSSFRNALGASSGTWPVSLGGTGATSFTSGRALIGSGTDAVTTRAITNNTSATAVTASTNLITANTLYYHKGNSNITTVGTISSGTWQGSAVGVAYGGTGATTAQNALTNLGIKIKQLTINVTEGSTDRTTWTSGVDATKMMVIGAWLIHSENYGTPVFVKPEAYWNNSQSKCYWRFRYVNASNQSISVPNGNILNIVYIDYGSEVFSHQMIVSG